MTHPDQPIELIQLTDPHLYADREAGLYGVNSAASLAAVVAEACSHPRDLAVISGDLVHDESEAGYRHLGELLAPLEVPTYLIPGNHDDAALMQTAFRQGQISCDKQVELGNWQVLLLNSQLPGQVGGHLDDRELDWLERSLRKADADASLIFLHHNPVPVGCKWLDPLGLDNPDKLFEVIAAHPQVKAVVWGHVHQEFDEARAGVRLLSTPSTCIQFKPGADEFELDYLPPGYRWFRLHPDGRLETGVRRLARVPEGLDPGAVGYGI